MTDTLLDRIAKFRNPTRADSHAWLMAEACVLLADCQRRIEELECPTPAGLMRCPFCGENDFDLEGLDNHLHRYCEKYGGLHAQEQRIQKLEEKLREAKEKTQELEELNEKRITDYRELERNLRDSAIAMNEENDRHISKITETCIERDDFHARYKQTLENNLRLRNAHEAQLRASDEELKALKEKYGSS